MQDDTGVPMTCSNPGCGREIGSTSYVVDGAVLCPDCYCKKFGVCG